jgi:DNA polymerase V
MTSGSDFEDGARAGRADGEGAPTVRRTSNAFGSPGTDSTVKRVDLNDAFIRHADATFVMRAAGDAMHGAGISDGDVLLVDRAITAAHGAVVIAVVDGELVCRRLDLQAPVRAGRHAASLVAADAVTPPMAITAETPLEVWGVVTTVIKTLSF